MCSDVLLTVVLQTELNWHGFQPWGGEVSRDLADRLARVLTPVTLRKLSRALG